MPKHFHRLPALITILGLVGLTLLGCSRAVATQTFDLTATLRPATATKEFIPTVPKNAQAMVIFSFEEDGYAHLFAYIPDQLPITRLTSDNWDDITPAASRIPLIAVR